MGTHLEELPGWLAKKGSDTALYRDEVVGVLNSLDYTHAKVQTSANHARFLIHEITSPSGLMPVPQSVYDAVQEFVYHYENYCLRLYILREKTTLYLNAALQIGFPVKEVNIKLISMQPVVKAAGLLPVLEKFNSTGKAPFGKLIKHRKSLTHRASYTLADPYLRPEDDGDESDFQTWCRQWGRNILEKAKQVDAAEIQASVVNHALAEKVLAYREPLRPSKAKVTGKNKS